MELCIRFIGKRVIYMMKKRLVRSCLLLISMLCLLTGCISEEERAQAESWRRQAEKNAVAYIEEKYGFEAQAVDSETQKVADLFGARLTSTTLVTMEYEGLQFKVLLDGEEEYMDEAADNYQKEELVVAIKEEVTAVFGVEPDFFDVSGGKNEQAAIGNGEEFFDMFYSTYYDGTNLEEVLTEEILYCCAEYVGDIDLEELYEKNKTSLFEDEYVHSAFVTYDSRENMERSVIHSKVKMDTAIHKHAIYIKEALFVEQGEASPQKFSIGQCDDFYYMCVGADISQYSISEGAELYDADDWNGHGFTNAAFVTDKAYYLEGDAENYLYIYVPKEIYAQIPTGEFEEKIVVSSRFISGNSEEISYNIWFSKDEIPGYFVFHTAYADSDDFSFRFMYDAEESE